MDVSAKKRIPCIVAHRRISERRILQMTTPRVRCLRISFETAYQDAEDDCCGSDGVGPRLCINSEYCLRASSPSSVGDFLANVLKLDAPTLAPAVAAYFSAQFEVLAGVGSFKECKQFDEVDANGALVPDGYSLCVCMASEDARKRRACVCRKVAPVPTRCCGVKA